MPDSLFKIHRLGDAVCRLVVLNYAPSVSANAKHRSYIVCLLLAPAVFITASS